MRLFISRLIFATCLILCIASCVEPELIVGQGQDQSQTEFSIGSSGVPLQSPLVLMLILLVLFQMIVSPGVPLPRPRQ